MLKRSLIAGLGIKDRLHWVHRHAGYQSCPELVDDDPSSRLLPQGARPYQGRYKALIWRAIAVVSRKFYRPAIADIMLPVR
jgi:hypothetical protein